MLTKIKKRAALAAVGSFARGTLAPFADVDVVLLCDDPEDKHVQLWAEALLYPLWDAKLSVGHAVRGVEETLALATNDLTTATTLLDLQPIVGDSSLVNELKKQGLEKLQSKHSRHFLKMLRDDTAARHERFGGSLFLLEPEVKLGRGGLRDSDVIGWVARTSWNAVELADLVAQDRLHSRELLELEQSCEFLWRVRNALHVRAQRKQDRLTFEDQEEIALLFAYVDAEDLAVEQFMRHYYQHAQTIASVTDRLLARATSSTLPRSKPTELGSGVAQSEEEIIFSDFSSLENEPISALHFYRQVVRQDKRPSVLGRDAVARKAGDENWCKALRAHPEAASLFLELLSFEGVAKVRRGSILGELLEVGLILAMIPEFEHVRGRVQHDIYHVYTVDVHSVAAVDRLAAIARGDFAEEWPLATHLATDSSRRRPLQLALLLHDIGKGRKGHHADIGADIAKKVCERLGIQEVDAQHIEWLVRAHLRLYHWAMRRDISDPIIIEEVIKEVRSVDRLRDLYLLTIADLSTTSPHALNAWKDRMLDSLFRTAVDAMDGSASLSRQERAADIREQLLANTKDQAEQLRLTRFWTGLPRRYVLSNTPEAIRAHAAIYNDNASKPLSLVVREGPDPELKEMILLSEDKPGLLASVAKVFFAHHIEVRSAQIYTRLQEGGKREVFDVFYVATKRKINGQFLSALQDAIAGLLSGDQASKEIIQKRSNPPVWTKRKQPKVSTKINVDNNSSRYFTVFDVYTHDHAGLLYTISQVFHEEGLTIGLSKLSTEGVSVADVFYVQTLKEEKIEDKEALDSLKSKLKNALERLYKEKQ
ncbi:MAG: [protein-PII] uridylyltransferase [Myxococcales bacterium]|nr:MAG: [protein-PII] uridylyltransferase [Myxococcales bacterium]